MAVLQHTHDFTSVQGGYQCQTCSAFLPQALIQANLPAKNDVYDDPNAILNYVYDTAGLP